jgi:hypothetical protein
MGPKELVSRAERQPEIPSQDLCLRNPKGCEPESVGPRLGIKHDCPTVDENPYVAVVVGNSRAEIEPRIRGDASAKAQIAWSIETRRPFICERRGRNHDQQNLRRRSQEARHVLSPQPQPNVSITLV